MHDIQGGNMSDHDTHDVASENEDKDPLAPSQQEKSELQ